VEPWYDYVAVPAALVAFALGGSGFVFRRRAIRVAITAVGLVAVSAIFAAVVFLVPAPEHDANIGAGLIFYVWVASVALCVGAATTGHDRRRATALPPPGWYPDPSRPLRTRFWDGSRWTEHAM
jgi:hypothetical protein